jgi:putative membrane protein
MAADALLAILHHLTMFVLVGLLFVEFALLRGSMAGPAIARFGRADALSGIAMIAVVVVGLARLAWGAVPADFYLSNLFFWVKMAALGAVSLIAISATIRAGHWRTTHAGDAAFEAPAGELVLVRRALWIELLILPLVPITAALMARGYGAF